MLQGLGSLTKIVFLYRICGKVGHAWDGGTTDRKGLPQFFQTQFLVFAELEDVKIFLGVITFTIGQKEQEQGKGLILQKERNVERQRKARLSSGGWG